VTAPKPEPGTGGGGCQIWPFCVHSAEIFSETNGENDNEKSDIPIVQAQANDPVIVAPPREQIPGIGGGICQGLIFCIPDEQVGVQEPMAVGPLGFALAPRPHDPVQEPGPLGPFCQWNPLCDDTLKNLNKSLLGLDQGIAGQ